MNFLRQMATHTDEYYMINKTRNGHLWYLSRFNTLVILIIFLGTSLLIPGIIMRIEHVPKPSPLLQLNICKDDNGKHYVGTSKPCDRKNKLGTTGNIQTFDLHDRMIVSDVAYIPVILLPDYALSGQVSFSLESPKSTIFRVTQKLNPKAQDRRGMGIVQNKYSKHEKITIYRKHNSHPDTAYAKACSSIEKGCPHQLTTSMKEILLHGTKFIITEGNDQGIEVFTSNLVLKIHSIFIDGKSIPTVHGDDTIVPPSPEIFITFHQSELSYVQANGIKLCMIGTCIIMLALVLAWAQSLLSRHKHHSH